MRISVITPTADRPAAFALCEQWMARQTLQPDEWIVADGGHAPVECTRGQIHQHLPQPSGVISFARNLLNALQWVTGDIVVCIEDDDHYAAHHIAQLVQQLSDPAVLLAGDDQQRYYNIQRRCFRLFDNVGASLCQTAFRASLLPRFQTIVEECLRRQLIGIDAALWKSTPREAWSLQRSSTVVGMKGLPGQVGLGIGHRPDSRWTPDPDLAVLTSWIGDDVERYKEYARSAA